MEKSKADKIFLVIQVVFVIWGLLSLVSGAVGTYNGYQILNSGRKVEGIIQSFHSARVSGRSPFNFLRAYEIAATYQGDNGDKLYATGYTNTFSNPTVGDKVTILYYKSNPELSTVYDPLSFWGVRALQLIIGFALIAGVYNYNRKKKANPNFQAEFEQQELAKMQQYQQRVNPYGFLGAQNPHATRNVFLLFLMIAAGFVLFGLLLSALGVK